MLFMGKSTISMAIYHSFLLVYQRVYPINIPLNHYKIPWNHLFIPLNHYFYPMMYQAGYHVFSLPGRVLNIDALPGAMCGTGGHVQSLHVAGGGSLQMGERTASKIWPLSIGEKKWEDV